MTISRSQIFGFTVNSTPYSATPLSGYTFATPFTFNIVASAGVTQAAITNQYQIVWWFGDGTTSTEFAPTHIYNWPGQYEVKVGFYNNNPGELSVDESSVEESLEVATNNNLFNLSIEGETPFTFSTTLTALNYIQDTLTWNTSVSGYYGYTWNNIMVGALSSGSCFYGYQSCKSGALSSGPIPLAFDYITTLTDNEQIKFKFYAQNSLSQPWTEVLSSQFSGLRPRWRFTTVSAAPLDDGVVMTELTPVSSTEIRILSSGVLSSTGTLVGLSGTVQFYYIDDIPSTVINNSTGVTSFSANPTTLWVVQDTFNLPNPQEYNSSGPSYSNSSILLSSFYFVQSLIPEHLNITLNGDIDLYNVYWPGVESRFVTTFASSALSGNAGFASNKTLLNYPVRVLSGSAPEDITFYVTLSGAYNPLSATQPPLSAVFNFSSSTPTTGNYLEYTVSNVDNLGRSTGGAYKGTFLSYDSTSSAVLYATLTAGELYYYTDYTPTPLSGFNPLTLDFLGGQPQIYSLTKIEGESAVFSIPNFDQSYFARKFNGAFDYGAYLKQIALQPTINQNEVLFDVFLASIAGISATNEETYGGVVYEKITNFVNNVGDIHNTNVDQFYALTKLIDLDIDNYNYSIPPTLSRIVDMYSVQQSRVWGARSQFARNFSPETGHTNLGTYLSAFNLYSAVVSAGQKIVFNDLFDQTKYEVLEVPPILSYSSVTARNLQSRLPVSNYPIASYPLTAYPLSAFFGWGVKTPIDNYYRVYAYDPSVNGQQKEGLINWDDPYTTLSETNSANNDWVKDEGILETIYNYYIHKGLGLIK